MEDKAPDKAPEGKTVPVVPGTPKPEHTGPEPVPGTPAPSPGQGKAEPTGKEAPAKVTPDKADPGKVIPIHGDKPTPGKDGPAKGDKAAPAKAGSGKGDKSTQGKEAPAKGDKPAQGKDSPSKGGKPTPGKSGPAKGDKTAPGKDKKERDNLSQGGKAEPKAPAPGEAPAEPPKEEPKEPPRPADQGKLVWLKLSEVHPFHTFRPHPFQVRQDAAMRELSESIKEKGVLQPGTVRPEKDGNGYEIIAGHRRTMASEMAGLEEMPFFVRDMTDHEAVQEMKDSNKQRPEMLPTELAALLALEVEDIKHQGGRLAGVAEGDKGKRSVEIVGEAHGLNYKKVMRYIRLNNLIPEFKDLVDGLIPKAKKMGFMPAVELSYLTKKHQQMVLVSMEGEQVYPSLSQAQQLRELESKKLLTGDAIDAILSDEKKKEVDKVIINTAELNKYFGESATPRQMKDQIIALLDEWKAKQPPEKSKPPKTAERG